MASATVDLCAPPSTVAKNTSENGLTFPAWTASKKETFQYYTNMVSDDRDSKRRDNDISEPARVKSEHSPSRSPPAHHASVESNGKVSNPGQSNDKSLNRSIKQELHCSPSAFQTQLGGATCSTDYGSIGTLTWLKCDECGPTTPSAISESDTSSDDSYFETFAPKGLRAGDPHLKTVDSSDTSDYGSITEDVTELEALEREALEKSYTRLEHHPPIQIEEPEPCAEQQRLVECIMQGKNVFYTGSAGCGKSTVLRNFVRKLRNIPKRVDVVAPTGAAALNIGGCTLQSYIGWGWTSTNRPLSKLKQDVHRKRVWQRVTSTDVLVIDEISMVENHNLERLNILLKDARADNRAFGGVQLVVTGDFCQLPPVKPFKYCIECGATMSKNESLQRHTCPHCGLEYPNYKKWAFHSKAWKEANFHHVNLTTVHRQVDPEFQDILEKVRLGRSLGSHETSLLMQHDSDTPPGRAIQLFPRCIDAKQVNDAKLDELKSPAVTYQGYDMTCMSSSNHLPNTEAHPHNLETLDHHRFEKHLTLKVGMPVVLLVNLKPCLGLVNGSQGIIIEFVNAPYNPPPPRLYEDQDHNDYWRLQVQWRAVHSFVDNSEFSRWPVVLFDNHAKLAIHPQAEDHDLGHASFVRAQIPLLPA